MSLLLGCADARRIPLPDESVQCVITSPPYWGLRSYSAGPAEIGLEASPDEYVAQMVAVFRQAWRVLRKDGTAWLNLGDSYCGNTTGDATPGAGLTGGHVTQYEAKKRPNKKGPGLKPKDLVGIPWRVALALQADGWYLRSDIIWAKGVSFCPTYSGSVMPESVRDRPTQSYEHVFLLAKSKTYYYDQEAVREQASESSLARINQTTFDQQTGGPKDYATTGINPNRSMRKTLENFAAHPGRNLRSVWTINPKPSKLAHYAAFPPALVEPMVLAGTSAKGCCPECGKGWERVIERKKPPAEVYTGSRKPDAIKPVSHPELGKAGMGQKLQNWYNEHPQRTIGWRPGCDCGVGLEPQPCVVLDCFGGTMTVGEVCAKHSRHFVGLDLKREYVKMGRERCANVQTAMTL